MPIQIRTVHGYVKWVDEEKGVVEFTDNPDEAAVFTKEGAMQVIFMLRAPEGSGKPS
jgi:hypothetical protein